MRATEAFWTRYHHAAPFTREVLADLGGPVLQAYVGTGLTEPRSDVVAGLQLTFYFGK